MHEIDKPKDHLGVALSDIRFGEVRCTCGEVRQFLDLCALLHLLSGIFKSYIVFANCNNKLSIQLVRSLLFEEDPAQLRREP